MDFPFVPGASGSFPPHSILSTADPQFAPIAAASLRNNTQFSTSGAVQVANAAIFQPYMLPQRFLAVKMAITTGTTPSGNVDVGIYDRWGTRLVSIGSTAIGAASTRQEFDITDTVLEPGLIYIAFAGSATTVTTLNGGSTHDQMRAGGARYMTSAFALPATATFAALSTTVSRAPLVTVMGKTVA